MNYDELKRQHEENMARIRQAMAQMPDSATRLASTVDYLTAERDEWRRRALAAEAKLAVANKRLRKLGYPMALHDPRGEVQP